MLCDTMPCDAMPCDSMLCEAMPCHMIRHMHHMVCHGITCFPPALLWGHGMAITWYGHHMHGITWHHTWHGIIYRVILCHVMPFCQIMSYHAILNISCHNDVWELWWGVIWKACIWEVCCVRYDVWKHAYERSVVWEVWWGMIVARESCARFSRRRFKEMK